MVDVNQVVRETLALRAYEQRVTNITVIDALAAGLPQVFADGHQVQQVLLNLIINAEQAMLSANGRGILVVRTWHDAGSGIVMLEINDDGPGIPDDLQPKIFDPFFTTKEVGKGTGLGLTVAYAIVQEHGGRIRLESRPSAGASFYVELPVTGAQAAAGAAVRARVEDPTDAVAGGVDSRRRGRGAAGERGRRCAARRRLRRRARGGRRGGAREGRARRPSTSSICDLKMPRLDGKAFYAHARGRRAGAAEARDLRDRRRRRHRRGEVPRGERLPLAGEAVQARRSAAGGPRRADLSVRRLLRAAGDRRW